MSDEKPPAAKPPGLDEIFTGLRLPDAPIATAEGAPLPDPSEPEPTPEEMIERDVDFAVELLEEVAEGTQGRRQFVVIDIDGETNEIGIGTLTCCRRCARLMLRRALEILDEEERDERKPAILEPNPNTRH